MGMYTGLRFKGYIKEEYRELVNAINEYAEWEDFKEKYTFLKNFTSLHRPHMIPNGSLSYMPDKWDKEWNEFNGEINMDNGYWSFQCSVNYGGEEIRTFINEVLSEILSKVNHVEMYYEEDRYSQIFDFVDGKFVENEANKVDYKPWIDEEEY